MVRFPCVYSFDLIDVLELQASRLYASSKTRFAAYASTDLLSRLVSTASRIRQRRSSLLSSGLSRMNS